MAGGELVGILSVRCRDDAQALRSLHEDARAELARELGRPVLGSAVDDDDLAVLASVASTRDSRGSAARLSRAFSTGISTLRSTAGPATMAAKDGSGARRPGAAAAIGFRGEGARRPAPQGIVTAHVIGMSLPPVSLACCTLEWKSEAAGGAPPQVEKLIVNRRGGGIALRPPATTINP